MTEILVLLHLYTQHPCPLIILVYFNPGEAMKFDSFRCERLLLFAKAMKDACSTLLAYVYFEIYLTLYYRLFAKLLSSDVRALASESWLSEWLIEYCVAGDVLILSQNIRAKYKYRYAYISRVFHLCDLKRDFFSFLHRHSIMDQISDWDIFSRRIFL